MDPIVKLRDLIDRYVKARIDSLPTDFSAKDLEGWVGSMEDAAKELEGYIIILPDLLRDRPGRKG